ncbi:MAK10-like protein [Tanacetum coccineum]|uniref:MAK10-like protein n=1 Tax=Tanacetum coccineum TaxID=301880 RepID=A0ABQ5AQQ8_9ASTR
MQICPNYMLNNLFLALGWHLEDLHMTWAHLEKKRTRLRTYTKSLGALFIQSVETASHTTRDGVSTIRRWRQRNQDGVRTSTAEETLEVNDGTTASGTLRRLKVLNGFPHSTGKNALALISFSFAIQVAIGLNVFQGSITAWELSCSVCRQPTQVNKITFSCEICSGPHDTQYCMENPEQAFVEYASSCIDEVRDRIAGALPSDTVKNPKLNINSTTLVLSARSYPMKDPQCSSQIHNLINAIKACSNQHNENNQSKDKILMVNKVGTPKSKEPGQTLEDEFKDLHLNITVLEVLAHAPIYNVILDKYVESLELDENGSAFIQGEIPKRIEDPGLFTLPCRLGNSKPFDTLADLGSCMNVIPLYLFKKLKIGLLEETCHVFGLVDGTKSFPIGIVRDVEVHIGRLKPLNDFYVLDMKKDPKTPLLVGRGFLATKNAVIDCRKAKIAVGKGITRLVFGVNETNPGEEETPYWTTLGKRESYKQ